MQSGWKMPSQHYSQEEMEAWKAQLDDIGEQYNALLGDLLTRMAPSEAADSVYSDMRESFEAAARSLMSNPNLLWQTQSRLMHDQWLLWQQGVRAMAGEQVTPLVTPPKHDRRFKDDAWTTDPYYMAIMQQYLLFSQMVDELIDDLDGLDPVHKRNLAFLRPPVGERDVAHQLRLDQPRSDAPYPGNQRPEFGRWVGTAA